MTVIDSAPPSTPVRWVEAVGLTELTPGRGVAVLLPDGSQVALFRTTDDALYAVGNIDPFGRAAVMSRGLVGDRAGEPTVASPLLKQVFSLVDGRCMDDPEVALAVYDVSVSAGTVAVAAHPRAAARHSPVSGAETISS